LITAFLALASSLSVAAQEKTHYRVHDLGTLGGSFGQAGGISNTGWIEGFSLIAGDTAFHEFLWHQGAMMDLGTLGGPNSISEWRPNDHGLAGGAAETAIPDPHGEDFCGFGTQLICRAFLWQKGVIRALPTLGGNNAQGFGTNDRGELAGTSETTSPEPTCAGTSLLFQFKPVIWKEGRPHELPTVAGDPVGLAFGLNNRGEAVGQTGPCLIGNLGTPSHAVLWRDGKAIDLGNLGGALNNIAEDINRWGQVVGFSDIAGDSTFHAFFWSDGVMKDLGTLPGHAHSIAESINSWGQVVGRSADASFNDGRGYVWEDGVMTDLNTLIPADSGLFILNATSNNDSGRIVGSALQMSTGEVHVFLLVPEDEDDDDGATLTARSAAAIDAAANPNVSLPEKVRRLVEQPRHSWKLR
jgi:probable HAF family extracellular repeat protein